jgi:hypothetical protein
MFVSEHNLRWEDTLKSALEMLYYLSTVRIVDCLKGFNQSDSD